MSSGLAGRLWIGILACNLGNLWRRRVLPQRIGNWSWTSLQQRLLKTGGRLVKQARYYWLLLAESHLTRRLFAGMLGRTDGPPLSECPTMLANYTNTDASCRFVLGNPDNKNLGQTTFPVTSNSNAVRLLNRVIPVPDLPSSHLPRQAIT